MSGLIMTDQVGSRHFDGAIETPVGWLGFAVAEGAVVRAELLTQSPQEPAAASELAQRVAGALRHYFDKAADWPTNLPLAPQGTRFQRQVWEQLCRIPPGQTRTYGELAEILRSSPRAVGGACRSNPIALLVPCHRVVAKHGDGGFSGQTSGHWMDVKRWLLAHERG